MKVLITGATGFMGSHLAERYLERGAEVVSVGLAKRPEEQDNARLLESKGARVVNGSVTDAELMRSLLPGVDLVFHLAVAMREAGTGDDYFRQVNVDGTRLLLEESRTNGVNRFIYCSTVGVVGHHQHGKNNEEAAFNPGDIYQQTKMEAETLVLAYGRETGYPTTAVRPAEVYGPRDRRLLKLFKGVKKGFFPIFGSGKGVHHVVYVDDCNDIFELAAESDAALNEVFIAAGNDAPPLNDLVAAVAAAAGRRPPRLHLPLGPVRLAAAVIEDICTPLRIQPPLYRRRVEFFTHDYTFDITKARTKLGWNPKTDLATGVRTTLAWYEQAGLL